MKETILLGQIIIANVTPKTVICFIMRYDMPKGHNTAHIHIQGLLEYNQCIIMYDY